MCRCLYSKADEIKEKYGYESVMPPIEMLSGRAYLNLTIKEYDKKKEKTLPLLLSHCPICGEEYKLN